MVNILYKLVLEGTNLVTTHDCNSISLRFSSRIATLVDKIEQRHRGLMPNFTICQVYQGGNLLNTSNRVATIVDFNDNDGLGTIVEVRYCKFIQVLLYSVWCSVYRGLDVRVVV